MYGKKGYNTYIDTDVKNAPTLFAKAISIGIRFAVEAKAAVEKKDIQARYNASEKLLNMASLLKSCMNQNDEKNKKFVLAMIDSFEMIAKLVTRVELEANDESCELLISYLQKLNRNWEAFEEHLRKQEQKNINTNAPAQDTATTGQGTPDKSTSLQIKA